MALLDRLPPIPRNCGPFEVKHGLRIAECYADSDVISRSLFWLGDFDPWVGRTLDCLAQPGDTVLDVGANIGTFAIRLAKRVGSRGHVHCFEPCPPHVQKLRANVQINSLDNVSVHEVALSDSPGLLHMTVPTHQQGMARVSDDRSSGAPYGVAAETFDRYWSDHGKAAVAVCKIDVEGHEPRVLEGMGESLRSGLIDSFVFERHIGGSVSDDEVVGRLRSAGFRVYRLHKHPLSVRAVECDGVGRVNSGSATADFVAIRRGSRAESSDALMSL